MFFMFIPNLGEDEPILTNIFLGGLVKNHQLDYGLITFFFADPSQVDKSLSVNRPSSTHRRIFGELRSWWCVDWPFDHSVNQSTLKALLGGSSHLAYIGFRIPPFGWYLKCLVIIWQKKIWWVLLVLRCPRKLGSMVSKWGFLPLIYSICK